MRASFGLEVRRAASKRTTSRSAGSCRSHRRELLALLVVLDEREHRLGVAEDVLALLRRVRRIEPDDDGADRHDRPVEQHPLEARAGEHRDRVAAADAAREQGVGEGVDPLAGLLPATPAASPRAVSSR